MPDRTSRAEHRPRSKGGESSRGRDPSPESGSNAGCASEAARSVCSTWRAIPTCPGRRWRGARARPWSNLRTGAPGGTHPGRARRLFRTRRPPDAVDLLQAAALLVAKVELLHVRLHPDGRAQTIVTLLKQDIVLKASRALTQKPTQCANSYI